MTSYFVKQLITYIVKVQNSANLLRLLSTVTWAYTIGILCCARMKFVPTTCLYCMLFVPDIVLTFELYLSSQSTLHILDSTENKASRVIYNIAFMNLWFSLWNNQGHGCFKEEQKAEIKYLEWVRKSFYRLFFKFVKNIFDYWTKILNWKIEWNWTNFFGFLFKL